jgi:diguanylate cyclase (GGDEF)-like protein
LRKKSIKKRELIENSIRDELTGVYNLRYLKEKFNEYAEISKREHTPLQFIMFDIDFFKKINDTYGHGCGDNVLKHLTKTIYNNIRHIDVFARVGGEEFVILSKLSTHEVRELTHKLMEIIRNSEVICNEHKVNFRISVGVASYNNKDCFNEINKKADAALYFSKNNGRDRLTCFDEM